VKKLLRVRALFGKVGVILVVGNLVAWILVYAVAPPRTQWPAPPATPTRPGEFHLFDCYDCPAFIVLNREFGTFWDPLPVKLLTLANLPSLWLASGPRDYFGAREIRPFWFVVSMVLQWLALGALAGVVYRAVFRSDGDDSLGSSDATAPPRSM